MRWRERVNVDGTVPRTLPTDLLNTMLHLDLIVFSNGLCAFNQPHSMTMSLFFGTEIPFIVRSVSNEAEGILVGPIGAACLDETKLLGDPSVQKVFTLI